MSAFVQGKSPKRNDWLAGPPGRAVRRGMAALLMLIATVSRAGAQPAPVSVSTQVSSDRVLVGDSITFAINVENAQTAEAPDVSGIADFSAQFLGGRNFSQTYFQSINGRNTQTVVSRYILTYTLTPLRAGTLTIPALKVNSGGSSYTTAPVRIIASDPAAAADTRARLEGPSRPIYVGEPVTVSVSWFFAVPARNPTITVAGSTAEVQLLPGPDPRPQGVPNAPGYYEIPFLGASVIGKVERTAVDGQEFDVLRFNAIALARKPGTLKLGPVRVAFDAVVGKRQASFFDSVFDDLSVTERRIATSNELVLEVRDLPSEGRPANFNGLIGEYSITSAASPTDVHLGDPISLNIRVDGPPPLDAVPPLLLARQPGIDRGFRVSAEPLLPTIRDGATYFSDQIRVTGAGVDAIPPVELPYFDTSEGAYRIARSKPIPLKVAATSEVVLPDGGSASDAPRPTASQRPGGLAPIERSSAVLSRTPIVPRTVARSPLLLGVVVAPPLTFAAVALGIAIRRRSLADPSAARRRKALARARRSLRTADQRDVAGAAALVSRSVCGLFADMLDLPDSSSTPSDCLNRAGANAGEAPRAAAQLLARCDSILFGGEAAAESDARALVKEARELLPSLAASLRGNAA